MLRHGGRRTITATEKSLSYLVVVSVIVISLAPIVWVLMSSFKTNLQILTSAFSLPKTLSLEAYVDAIKISNFHVYFLNSVIITSVSVVIGVCIYSLAGYVLARFTFFGQRAYLLILALTILIPGHATIQPIFTAINLLNLYDTKVALISVYSMSGMAVAIFILRSGFFAIPRELEESAYIDGASFLKTFTSIVIPLAKPSIVTVVVLRFLNHWNEFLFAFLLTSSEKNRTIPVSFRYFVLQYSYNFPSLFAAIMMAIVPSIILYMIFLETITSSITSGSLKG